MAQTDTSNAKPSFPLTQRELVGLALQRGCRRADFAPAAPGSQRERVRLALALGVGVAPKGASGARRGIHR
jgi:hypothetical protein